MKQRVLTFSFYCILQRKTRKRKTHYLRMEDRGVRLISLNKHMRKDGVFHQDLKFPLDSNRKFKERKYRYLQRCKNDGTKFKIVHKLRERSGNDIKDKAINLEKVLLGNVSASMLPL